MTFLLMTHSHDEIEQVWPIGLRVLAFEHGASASIREMVSGLDLRVGSQFVIITVSCVPQKPQDLSTSQLKIERKQWSMKLIFERVVWCCMHEWNTPHNAQSGILQCTLLET